MCVYNCALYCECTTKQSNMTLHRKMWMYNSSNECDYRIVHYNKNVTVKLYTVKCDCATAYSNVTI